MSVLKLDRFADSSEGLEVVTIDGLEVCSDEAARAPHRHDYHELIWTRTGEGHHRLDGRKVAVAPRTITLIGRGQVHVFERAREITGAAIRFGDELLHGDSQPRPDPSGLLVGCGGRIVHVPEDAVDGLDATIAALASEADGDPDERSAELQRHLLSVVLLWVERWQSAAHHGGDDDEQRQLYSRFARVLERDYAAHHDVAHYADALALPPAALSQALARVTGRTTKELITDRVMVEATRLLRYTDQAMGEIAYATGFADPLYFSRAFKRHQGIAPSAYRERVKGRA